MTNCRMRIYGITKFVFSASKEMLSIMILILQMPIYYGHERPYIYMLLLYLSVVHFFLILPILSNVLH